MSPKKKAPQRDLAAEAAALDKPVRMDGVGEDPAVKALLRDDFPELPNRESVEIGLALQQIIRGQASMLDNQDKFSKELDQVRRQMDEYDKAAERWENDKANWLDEMAELREKTRRDSDPEKVAVNAIEATKKAYAEATATAVSDQMSFDDALSKMSTETIVSPGRIVNMKQGSGIVPTLEAEVIRLKHRQWVLPPGVSVEVPKLVADVYRQKQLEKQADQEFRDIYSLGADGTEMGPQHNEKKVISKLQDFGKKHKMEIDPRLLRPTA
jgi:hypothetical protein